MFRYNICSALIQGSRVHVTGKIIYGEITDREGVVSCHCYLFVDDDCFSDEAQNNNNCCRGDNLSGAAI